MEPLTMSWRDHWKKAQENGITGSVVVGTMISTSDLALKIASEEPSILAAVGVHPIHAHEVTLDQLEIAGQTWAKKNPRAVGETGLDYYRLDRSAPDFEKQAEHQRTLFRWHIRFAEQHSLPLILHIRDKKAQAYWETLEILKSEYKGSRPFVLHCASGPLDYVREAIELGGYVGFDGNITYPNAGDIRTLVKNVPVDRLMIETDAPFLAPQKFRGSVCEPWMITETARFAHEELNLSPDQIFTNTQQFFNFSFGE
jgi:TatD DNase family protein